MEIQLQSILMPRSGISNIEELYCHNCMNRIDFDGYFNLFYIKKRKTYSRITNLHLFLRLIGYDRLILMHDQEVIKEEILDPYTEKEYVTEFPYSRYEEGVFWFSLVEKGENTQKKLEGWYGAEIEAEQCLTVNIGIDICTYRRELYVERNLTMLAELMESGQAVSPHIQVYVVDNGGTLEGRSSLQEILDRTAGRIQIIPNRNTGGSGGFTRGMLEVLEDREKRQFTHILLADDDATMEPDAFVRLYGLLVTLRPEWRDVTVGGSMMREDCPHMLFCAGERWENGSVIQPEQDLDMRLFSNALSPYLADTGHEREWYSGWWFCCYSLNVARKDNLPLPLFLHHDDIEFGLRNQDKGVIFLNGIGVWHKGADLTFSGSNLYYDTRNNLIELALHGTGDIKKTALKIVLRSVTSAAIWMRCKDAAIVYQGVLDFLKGPQWLARKKPEKIHEKIRGMCYNPRPVDEVIKELSGKDRKIARKELSDFDNLSGMDAIARNREKKKKAKWYCYLTYNGWLLPADKSGIRLVASTDSPFDVFRGQRILLFEPGSRKALVVERRYGDLGKVIKIYVKILIVFLKYFDSACKNYRENIGNLTNQVAWKEYLREK